MDVYRVGAINTSVIISPTSGHYDGPLLQQDSCMGWGLRSLMEILQLFVGAVGL